MRGKLIVILLAGVLLESTIISFPITLIIVSVYVLSVGADTVKWAFFGGLLLDFLAIRALGETSIFFLSMSWVISRYKKKLHFGNIIYFIIFLSCVSTFYGFLFFRFVTGLNVVGSLAIGAFILGIVKLIVKGDELDKSKIKI